MKQYIRSQALSRFEVLDSLEEQTLNTLQHLAYLYVFGEVQDYNHWHNEVWKFYHRMPKIRIGRKVRYLKEQEFLDATYCQYNSDEYLKYVLQSAPELKKLYEADMDKVNNISEFKDICDQYFTWLAKTICNSGYVLPVDCYLELEKLGV